MASRQTQWTAATALAFSLTIPGLGAQRPRGTVKPANEISMQDKSTGILTSRLSTKQLKIWESILDIVHAMDANDRLLHPKPHSLFEWAEMSDHVIYIEMVKARGVSPYLAGNFRIEKFDPMGRSHAAVIRLYPSVIDSAWVKKWIRRDDGLIQFEGLRSKAQRYAEVLGHELAHAAVILEDPDHARLVQELDSEIKEFEMHRRTRNRGAFDEEACKRLDRIKSLTAKVEAIANPVEVEVWRELRESQHAESVLVLPPR